MSQLHCRSQPRSMLRGPDAARGSPGTVMTSTLLLLLSVSSYCSACSKAASDAGAASSAKAGQLNRNDATSTTNVNLGDTSLLQGYHEESVVMSVIAISIMLILLATIFYCIKKHNICKQPLRAPPRRRDWGQLSLRKLQRRLDPALFDTERFEELQPAPRPCGHNMIYPPANRCQDLKNLAAEGGNSA